MYTTSPINLHFPYGVTRQTLHNQKFRITWLPTQPQACADNTTRDWKLQQNRKEIWEKGFTFLFFVIFIQMATFPSLKIKKAVIKLHFHRTRNDDNFILATALCEQNNSRQAQWKPLLTSYNSAYLHVFLSVRWESSCPDKFPQLPIQNIRCLSCKTNVFFSKKLSLRHCLFTKKIRLVCKWNQWRIGAITEGKMLREGLFSFCSGALWQALLFYLVSIRQLYSLLWTSHCNMQKTERKEK